MTQILAGPMFPNITPAELKIIAFCALLGAAVQCYWLYRIIKHSNQHTFLYNFGQVWLSLFVATCLAVGPVMVVIGA